jgi:hypothetical protein
LQLCLEKLTNSLVNFIKHSLELSKDMTRGLDLLKKRVGREKKIHRSVIKVVFLT